MCDCAQPCSLASHASLLQFALVDVEVWNRAAMKHLDLRCGALTVNSMRHAQGISAFLQQPSLRGIRILSLLNTHWQSRVACTWLREAAASLPALTELRTPTISDADTPRVSFPQLRALTVSSHIWTHLPVDAPLLRDVHVQDGSVHSALRCAQRFFATAKRVHLTRVVSVNDLQPLWNALAHVSRLRLSHCVRTNDMLVDLHADSTRMPCLREMEFGVQYKGGCSLDPPSAHDSLDPLLLHQLLSARPRVACAVVVTSDYVARDQHHMAWLRDMRVAFSPRFTAIGID
jgi:hypothetical protein